MAPTLCQRTQARLRRQKQEADMWRKAILGCCAVALTLAFGLVGVVGAGSLPVGTVSSTPIGSGTPLDSSHPVLDFEGSFSSPIPVPTVNPQGLIPQQCVQYCQEFSLDVATAQPVLVSIENSNGSIDDGLDLYVYDPSDNLVASDNGIGNNGEAVEIPKPAQGTYTIVVTITYADNPVVQYLGEARIMAPPSWQQTPTCGITVGGHTGCFYLPSLVALPATDLHVSGLPPIPSTSAGFPIPANVPVPTSCYLNETLGLDSPSASNLENPVTRCLRFTTDVQNVGAGPLQVQALYAQAGTSPQVGFVPGECAAEQVVYATDGSTHTRPAGSCEAYLLGTPPQLPYGNVVAFSLYDVLPSGALGSQVDSAYKASYCLTDDVYFGFGTSGPNSPNQFTGQPNCSGPSQVEQSATGADAWAVEGISPGWGDLYTWDTADQYLNITGLPDGVYAIVERVNPNGDMLASSPDPCSYTDVLLTQSTATATGSGYLTTCPPGSAGPGTTSGW